METPTKQLKNGFSMPVFGIGTWGMGGKRQPDTSGDPADIAALRRAIELGISHIDTAEAYGGGHSEELVGEAIRGHDRTSLFIVSKALPENAAPERLHTAAKESLRRLQLEYLDGYLLHSRNTKVPLSETMMALDQLVDQGLVRHIGVSNFNKESLEEAQKHAKHPVVLNQVHYNLEYREPEASGLLEDMQANDVFLSAYQPVARGTLRDDFQTLQNLGDKYGKTPYQVAINWLISQKNVITLSKMTNERHLKENLGALGWELESRDIELLRTEYPEQKTISDPTPLG